MQSPGSQGTRDASTPEIEKVFSLAADPQLAENSRQGSERKNLAFALGFEELKSQTMQWGSWQASGRTASVPTVYLYTGANLVDEVDQNGNLVTRYTLGDDVDEPFAALRGGVTSYYQADGTWSVTSLSNTTGNLSKTYTYDAFGVVVSSTGTLTNSIQYTGRESDPETGLYFYRARYYDPTIGRFVLEDPIRWDGGPNFYPYVSNEPTLYRDPTGLLQLCCRPARSVTWTGAKACHCFLKLSDGTTLGAYFKPPPFLHKNINDPDDKSPKDKPDCKDLPGSECKVRQAFNDLPTNLLYGIQGTSNAIPYRTLTAAGVPFTMPSCAWGASVNPYPVVTGPFVPTW